MAFANSQTIDQILTRGLAFRLPNNAPISSLYTLYANGSGLTYWSNSINPTALSTLSTTIGDVSNIVIIQGNQIYDLSGKLCALSTGTDTALNNLSNYLIDYTNSSIFGISTFSTFYAGLFELSTSTGLADNDLSTSISVTNSTSSAFLTSTLNSSFDSRLVSSSVSLLRQISTLSSSVVYTPSLISTTAGLNSGIVSTSIATNANISTVNGVLSTSIFALNSTTTSTTNNLYSTIQGYGPRIGSLETLSTNLSSISGRWISSQVGLSQSTLTSTFQTQINVVASTLSSVAILATAQFGILSTISTGTFQQISTINAVNLVQDAEISTLARNLSILTTSSILAGVYDTFIQLENYTVDLINSTVLTTNSFLSTLYFSTVTQTEAFANAYFSTFSETVFLSSVSTTISYTDGLVSSTILTISSFLSTLYFSTVTQTEAFANAYFSTFSETLFLSSVSTSISYTDGLVSSLYSTGTYFLESTITSTLFGRTLDPQVLNSTNVKIALGAGTTDQNEFGIAIGYNAGSNFQGTESVAIGPYAGSSNQSDRSVAIGLRAGQNSQRPFAVAIGADAGSSNQSDRSVAIGLRAGQISQQFFAVAIGTDAGSLNQSDESVAIGLRAGQNSQGFFAVAIGADAGSSNQGDRSVAIGAFAGKNFQLPFAVALGYAAGSSNQGGIAIGYQAGSLDQHLGAVAIGKFAAFIDQSGAAVAIGDLAGNVSQGEYAVALGYAAGSSNQAKDCVAIGNQAGSLDQRSGAVAAGVNAGRNNQNASAVAIGNAAGSNSQGAGAVALGVNSGQTSQGASAIAIGSNAGLVNQGANAIAIGFGAGSNAQVANSIVLNASNVSLDATANAGFYVNPIRNVVVGPTTYGNVWYNSTTKEIFYNTTLSASNAGNTSSALVLTSGYSANYPLVGGSPSIRFDLNSGGFPHYIISRHNNAVGTSGNAVDFWMNNSASGVGLPGTNTKFVMSVTAAGVGIGTSNPGYTLDVDGNQRIRGNEVIQNIIANTVNSAVFTEYNNSAASSRFLIGTDGTGLSGVGNAGAGSIGTWSANPLIFFTNQTERMRITSAGNVGIGTTTTPTERLTVNGKTLIFPPDDTIAKTNLGAITIQGPGRQLGNNTAQVGLGHSICFRAETNPRYDPNFIETVAAIRAEYDIGNVDTLSGSHAITFHNFLGWGPNGEGSLSEKMRITSQGNVGIGTTTPTDKLSIVDSAPSDVGISVSNSYNFDPNPNANGTVNAIAIQTDGKIIVGGSFTTIGGITRNRIARLNSDGTLDTGFNPNANDIVRAIAIQTDGKIFVVGDFTNMDDITRNRIARLNSNGTLDNTFLSYADEPVRSIAIQIDEKIIIGGDFTIAGNPITEKSRIARLNSNGSVDTGFNAYVNPSVRSIAIQTDGKIIIGGDFIIASTGGLSRNRIARLDSTGIADTFNPNANGTVNAIAIQTDGKIIIGGAFTTIGGFSRNRIARLNSNGTLDNGFNPNADGIVSAIAIQTDGKIIVGGDFTSMGGITRNRIALLNTNGTLDTFNPNANASVEAIAKKTDGKIIIGGSFTTIGVSTINRIALLNENGNPSINDGAYIQLGLLQNYMAKIVGYSPNSLADGYLDIYTRSNNTLTQKVTITNTGNVGIGTTTPQAKLDVNGDIRVSGRIIDESGAVGTSITRFVPTGTAVVLGIFEARIPSSGNRSLQFRVNSGSYRVYGKHLYVRINTVAANSRSPSTDLLLNSDWKYWNDTDNLTVGDISKIWLIDDFFNPISWKIECIIGDNNNNIITIKRLH